MNRKEINILLDKYLAGECSEEEKALVETWYNQRNLENNFHLSEDKIEKDIKSIYGNLPQKGTKSTLQVLRYVAAIALLVFSVSLYFFLNKQNDNTQGQVQTVQKLDRNIRPGGNKATLTLADGTEILLDDVAIGAIAEQAGNTIYKNENGEIIYKLREEKLRSAIKPTLNTITTPLGGQYNVILPDGTKVWLNAASSLTYSTVFTGSERVVKLKGEGYFEVAKNPTKPFKVITNDQTVEVLGTHFNIKAYDNEDFIETTLLEGAVKVLNKGKFRLLIPGQQARVNSNEGIQVLKLTDVQSSIAWKEGYFQFDYADLESLMRQIARWYDVNIKYMGSIPRVGFNGKAPRNSSISELIAMLNYAGVKCELKSQTIYIYN